MTAGPPGITADAARLYNTAVQHYMAQQMPQAEQACRRALELSPRLAEALHLLGAMHADRGEIETAIGYFRQTVDANPQFLPGRVSLAMALRKLGQRPEAEAAFRQILALHPDSAEALLGLGGVLSDLERTDEADDVLRRALTLNPMLMRPDNELGAAARARGLYVSYRPASDAVFNLHPEFKALLRSWVHGNENNNSGDIARLYMLMMNLKQVIAEDVAGDMAEVGVYRGNSAAVLAHYARSAGRQLYLFDTFEGFDRRDLEGVDKTRPEDFTDTSLPQVRQLVGESNVSFIQGYFPQSIPEGFGDRVFAAVNLDCDLYLPMKAGLEFFYPRLSPGGIMLLHDYSSGYFPGAKQAIDEFVQTIPENIVLQPDLSGTAVIRKSSPPRR